MTNANIKKLIKIDINLFILVFIFYSCSFFTTTLIVVL